jgi:hypothetical protein
MKRRDFMTQLGDAALAWPFAALAQRATIPFIGYLSGGLSNEFELVLNLKTAKKRGGTVSRDFLARVDEVIQ